ncbi:unnamed protein product [Brachionus calyciflorus]|uniref:peptidylprolyl isomerase n=1 Tax=Brachionus calyciflorus TaxID=104777 RepID=A0A813P9E2_9BILA|nr:unnamed protein product [Brachionus calyciflorus]
MENNDNFETKPHEEQQQQQQENEHEQKELIHEQTKKNDAEEQQIEENNTPQSDNQIETDNKQLENASLSESIVNIPSIPHNSEEHKSEEKCQDEHEPEQKTYEENNLTESMVNIQSMPSENETKSEETFEKQDESNKNQSYEQNNLTESMVHIQSISHSADEEKANSRPGSPPPPSDTTEYNPTVTSNPITDSIIEVQSEQIQSEEDKISITQSTIVLSHSQMLNENLQSCLELEAINQQTTEFKETNLNTESVIVTNLSSEASSFVTSPVNSDKPDFVEEISKHDEEELVSEQNETEKESFEQTTQEASEKEEVDKLVKEYEIPNFADNILKNEIESLTQEISAKLQEVRGKTEEELKEELEKKPERQIENEKYENILGNDSLLKKTLKYGDSVVGRPTNGQMVTINYEAYLKDNRDQLVDHNEDYSFILGDGDVIPAMDMVVCLMDKNEVCEMITVPRLAYGDLGKQPDISPKADLVYKIELKDFRHLTDLNEMGPVERLSLAEAKKLRGNFHYNRQDFSQAIQSYKKGIRYFDENSLKGDEEDQDLKKFLELSQALLMNTALSYYKLGELKEALETLENVLNAQNNHIKALYIKGKILLQMGETEEAVKSLSQAVKLEPSNSDIQKELSKAQAKHKIQYENEKKMYQKMMSGASKKEETKKAKIIKKNESNFTNYLAAGAVFAVASIGVALFARYKNLF